MLRTGRKWNRLRTGNRNINCDEDRGRRPGSFIFEKSKEEHYMMNFKDFCDQIEKNVSSYLPPQYQGAQIRI